jgi:predicted DCC family thiol-disulfide oxidoreductase YuxK
MKDYAVYRVHRDNHDKQILFRDLTREEAMSLVQNAPKEKDSMVVFDEMPRNMLWGRS